MGYKVLGFKEGSQLLTNVTGVESNTDRWVSSV